VNFWSAVWSGRTVKIDREIQESRSGPWPRAVPQEQFLLTSVLLMGDPWPLLKRRQDGILKTLMPVGVHTYGH
jgi:hypothetical protein